MSAIKTKVFFRADGHAKMGLGHVVRSLALAEMLQDQFSCHFIIRNPLPSLHDQILNICESIIELPSTEYHDQEAEYLCNEIFGGDEIIVLDGYHFRTDYQSIIKKKGCRVVCIDDIHAYHFVADVIINHAAGISEADYAAESYTQFFLGLKYALLRKPFREAAQHRSSIRQEPSILICMGGADPHNDTLEVLKKCETLEELFTYYVVIGPAYQFHLALDAYIHQSELNIRLLNNISAMEMRAYMQRCAVAITPPSTVAYEYLSVGGVLYLKVTADNQIRMNESFIAEGLAFSFDDFDQDVMKEKFLPELLQRQALFFDGNQQNRFIHIFKSIVSA